ncbi:CBS domain-containing protein [Streptomyces sp. NPDC052236]|uniref:CBS domain-containing protein n=1 Tax=Streptomyces sp. NPDC052236 TaxID=3365686 RepID=UPI0037D03910
MTAPPVQASPRAYVTDVARRMRDEDIGAALVTEDGHLRGLVSDRDLSALVTVAPDDRIDHAVHLMRATAVRRLPVVDADRDCVVGLVALVDLALERDPDSALGNISAAEPNR